MLARQTLALAVLLAVAAGCGTGSAGTDPTSPATRQFAADNGSVTIAVAPKRVVATGYAVPTLIEVGAPLVGISSWARGETMMSAADLATYRELPKVAGEAAAETNYEAIAKAEPDLIVIGVPQVVVADLDLKRLEAIAPVVTIGPNTPTEWREVSRRQADAAGRLASFDKAKIAYEKKAAELKAKYADALRDVSFGHLGGYGEVAKGTFMREFAGSWGTNIAGDLGVRYPGEVKAKGPGAKAVSEHPSIEVLPESFAGTDAITYTLEPDGSPGESVRWVLGSQLWKNLPAVKAGRAIPVRYTQAATYGAAMLTLDSLDAALAPLVRP